MKTIDIGLLFNRTKLITISNYPNDTLFTG